MKQTEALGAQSETHPKLPWHAGQIRVLKALHQSGRASRVELSALTGLSPQSITRITQELIANGLVQELKRRHTGGMGQPAIELGLVPGRLLSLGLVIEFDRLTCLTSDLATGLVSREVQAGDFIQAAESLRAGEAMVRDALAALSSDAFVLGLGLSQSGFFFDPSSRKILSRGDVEGWMSLDLAAHLEALFGLDVTLENDGCAAAAGHLIHGVGTQYSSFFLVYMTRGVGGGAVYDRRLIRGRAGNAGEIAELLPRTAIGIPRPSVESLNHFMQQAWREPVTPERIQTALTAQDPALMDWLDQSAFHLNQALLSVCALLDPEAIILAGRLPLNIRHALAARLTLKGASYAGVSAPAPEIVVDPDTDCLELGVTALPVTRFFSQFS
ncbi:MAG: ROK family transcriptional regulator [Asticcacaulis sp.]